MFARFAGIAAATSGKRLDPTYNRKKIIFFKT
jgi:hypothetical protein